MTLRNLRGIFTDVSGVWLLMALLPRIGFALTVASETPDSANYTLEEVICVTSRLPVTTATSARSVTVLSRQTLQSAPGFSISEKLASVPGVGVRRRGGPGVQADLSVRGGTFEQTVIMMDGVKLNDPQTGHHNLDLPLTLDQIERVEVLRGSCSSLYGPGAFSGAVNIVTRQGGAPSLSGSASVGEYGLSETTLSATHPVGNTRQTVSASRTASGGYIEDTDFTAWSGFYRGIYPIKRSEFDLAAGFANKEFGANSFYSSAFPHEYEATETRFVHARFQTRGETRTLAPSIFWRRHSDDFRLERNQPDRNHNRHTTDVLGGELHAALESKIGQTVVGGELVSHQLASSNLRDHSRMMGGLFAEQRLKPLGCFQGSAGTYFYQYGEFGWKAWPDFSVMASLAPRFSLHGSAGWSFRVPTFTELYYSDQANAGNPKLQAESAWTYEIGARYYTAVYRAELSAFHRESHDLIDWVRTETAAPWRALNVSKMNTTGLEAELFWRANNGVLSQALGNYTRLFVASPPADNASKYARLYLRQQAALELSFRLPGELKTNWSARYLNREDRSEVFLLDARLARPFANVEPFLSVTNLLDREYFESGFAPMPGRWLRGGIIWNIGL